MIHVPETHPLFQLFFTVNLSFSNTPPTPHTILVEGHPRPPWPLTLPARRHTRTDALALPGPMVFHLDTFSKSNHSNLSFGIGIYLKKRNLIDTVPAYFYASLDQQFKRADGS